MNRIYQLSSLFFALLCFSLFIITTDLKAIDSQQIGAIEITGTRRVDSAVLLEQIHSKAPIFNTNTVSQDIKSLYQIGFFDQVSAKLVQNPGSKPILRFEVIEKPVVRKISISGNDEIDSEELQKILTLSGRKFLDRAQLLSLVKNAEELYQSKGYYDAQIEYTVLPIADGEVDLSFSVKEGQRYKISKIHFRGLNEVDQDELAEVIQTREHTWWKSWLLGTGRLNQAMLNNDVQIVRQYLLDHGYVDAKISQPIVEKKAETIEIVFDVEEGPRYNFGQINANGDLIDSSPEQTLDGIATKSRETFSAATLRDDTFKISDKFSDRGYAYVNVEPNTKINRDNRLVDVTFEIAQGKQVSVDNISIRGNDKTFDNVIRRELTIVEQEIYSGAKVKRSQQLLKRLGLFEEATITPAESKEADKIDLNVTVREASTGTLSAGAGFSTSDGALFNAKITENNLFGTGRRVNLSVDVGDKRNNQVLSLDDPRLNDSLWGGGIDLVRTDREYRDFDREQTGTALYLSHPLESVLGKWAEDMKFSLQYELYKIDISNIDIEDAAQLVIDSEGKSTVSAISPKVVRNSIDNPLSPSEGSQQALELEFAGLGGSEKYYLAELSNQWYYPILKSTVGDFVFSLRTKFGYGDSYNDDPFPLFRRYFPGGINSVRGFKNRTLGPTDENDNEFGGSKQLVHNTEIIFPLVESAGLKGVIFHDIGEAFDDDDSIEFGELRQAYGYGIRWTSPLGPIRVEFGFPIDREEGEDSMVTMFSFGAPL